MPISPLSRVLSAATSRRRRGRGGGNFVLYYTQNYWACIFTNQTAFNIPVGETSGDNFIDPGAAYDVTGYVKDHIFDLLQAGW